MLLNIADDLKSVSKLKIAPGSATQLSTPSSSGEKPKTFDAVKEMAEKQTFVKIGKDEVLDDGDEDAADSESRPSYLFMEVHSTAKTTKGTKAPVAKKEIDVEKMVETFSMDDFMKGLYVTHQHTGPSKGTVQDKN